MIKLYKIGIIVIAYLLIMGIYFYNSFTYYSYIDSIEKLDFRYSLYEYSIGEVNQYVIFKHKLNYTKYRKVKISQLSLNILNGNKQDIYLYDLYVEDPSGYDYDFLLNNERYIVFKHDSEIYFVFDTYSNEILYDAKSESEGVNDIRLIIE